MRFRNDIVSHSLGLKSKRFSSNVSLLMFYWADLFSERSYLVFLEDQIQTNHKNQSDIKKIVQGVHENVFLKTKQTAEL